MSIKKKQRCYYEVLEIEDRSAAIEDIRRNYKKLILKWHPDKNINQQELAAERFRELQQAWEILSDPAERKWYDDHRDLILQGGPAEEFEGVDLWAYFTPSCYNGFGDSENGFYSVYRNLFKTLDEEEFAFDKSRKPSPEFGKSDTVYSEVKKFYDYWTYFVTKKDFSWRDKFDLREAPNRFTRKILEKENKKERDKGKKSFNEQVRKLVELVKKRDLRVAAYQKQLLKEKQEQAQKQLEIQKKRAEVKKQEMERLKQELSKKPSDFDEEQSEEEEPEEIEVLCCPVCNKKFKSDRQYANHENSKKHKSNLAKLKQEVMLNGEFDRFGEEGEDGDFTEDVESDDGQVVEDFENTDVPLPNENLESPQTPIDLDDDGHVQTSNDQADLTQTPDDKEDLPQTPDDKEDLPQTPDDKEDLTQIPDDKEDLPQTPEDKESQTPNDIHDSLQNRPNQSATNPFQLLVDDEDSNESDEGPKNMFSLLSEDNNGVSSVKKKKDKRQRNKQLQQKIYQEKKNDLQILQDKLLYMETQRNQKIVPKAQINPKKRRRRRNKTNPVESGETNLQIAKQIEDAKDEDEDEDYQGRGTNFRCSVCKQTFQTRNLLFKHIKKENHAKAT
eukprot:TRINITY_DN697_c0_g1_i1.p1 TRINITY_DN697_c0_g1~~TRINITY_DN697_c0_g1_i1.p1  ORF type:complete len:615 (-),score=184.76 TRINITY_DN697_c0_g1_i1:68-1912(-)